MGNIVQKKNSMLCLSHNPQIPSVNQTIETAVLKLNIKIRWILSFA